MSTPWFMYNITQGYTVGHGGNHDGWDFGAPSKTPLISLTGGKVTSHTGWYDWGGEIDTKGGVLGGGVTETFAHADRIDVKPGDTVFPGQQVGLSGGEGLPRQYSTGPHVHYSLFGGAPWDNRYSIDPKSFLDPVRKNGGISGLFNPNDIPGVQEIANAITNAYSGAEQALGKTIKRAGYFVLGLLLVALGLGLLVLAAARSAGKEAAPYVGQAAKLAAIA